MAIASSFSLGGIILLVVLGVGIFFMIGMLFDIDIFSSVDANPHDLFNLHDPHNPLNHYNLHNDSTHRTSDRF